MDAMLQKLGSSEASSSNGLRKRSSPTLCDHGCESSASSSAGGSLPAAGHLVQKQHGFKGHVSGAERQPPPGALLPLQFLCAFLLQPHELLDIVVLVLEMLTLPPVHLSRIIALRAGCCASCKPESQRAQPRPALFINDYDNDVVRNFPCGAGLLGRAVYLLRRLYPFNVRTVAFFDPSESLYFVTMAIGLVAMTAACLLRRWRSRTGGGVAGSAGFGVGPAAGGRSTVLRHAVVSATRLALQLGNLLACAMLWRRYGRTTGAMLLQFSGTKYYLAEQRYQMCLYTATMALTIAKLPLHWHLPVSLAEWVLAMATAVVCDLMTHGSVQRPVAAALIYLTGVVLAPAALLYGPEQSMRQAVRRARAAAAAAAAAAAPLLSPPSSPQQPARKRSDTQLPALEQQEAASDAGAATASPWIETSSDLHRTTVESGIGSATAPPTRGGHPAAVACMPAAAAGSGGGDCGVSVSVGSVGGIAGSLHSDSICPRDFSVAGSGGDLSADSSLASDGSAVGTTPVAAFAPTQRPHRADDPRVDALTGPAASPAGPGGATSHAPQALSAASAAGLDLQLLRPTAAAAGAHAGRHGPRSAALPTPLGHAEAVASSSAGSANAGSNSLYTSRLGSCVVSVKVRDHTTDEAFPQAAAAVAGAAGSALRSWNAAALMAAAEMARAGAAAGLGGGGGGGAGPVRRGGSLMSRLSGGVVVRGCVHLIQVVRVPRSRNRHLGWRLDSGKSIVHTGSLSAVPATAADLSRAGLLDASGGGVSLQRTRRHRSSPAGHSISTTEQADRAAYEQDGADEEEGVAAVAAAVGEDDEEESSPFVPCDLQGMALFAIGEEEPPAPPLPQLRTAHLRIGVAPSAALLAASGGTAGGGMRLVHLETTAAALPLARGRTGAGAGSVHHSAPLHRTGHESTGPAVTWQPLGHYISCTGPVSTTTAASTDDDTAPSCSTSLSSGSVTNGGGTWQDVRGRGASAAEFPPPVGLGPTHGSLPPPPATALPGSEPEVTRGGVGASGCQDPDGSDGSAGEQGKGEDLRAVMWRVHKLAALLAAKDGDAGGGGGAGAGGGGTEGEASASAAAEEGRASADGFQMAEAEACSHSDVPDEELSLLPCHLDSAVVLLPTPPALPAPFPAASHAAAASAATPSPALPRVHVVLSPEAVAAIAKLQPGRRGGAGGGDGSGGGRGEGSASNAAAGGAAASAADVPAVEALRVRLVVAAPMGGGGGGQEGPAAAGASGPLVDRVLSLRPLPARQRIDEAALGGGERTRGGSGEQQSAASCPAVGGGAAGWPAAVVPVELPAEPALLGNDGALNVAFLHLLPPSLDGDLEDGSDAGAAIGPAHASAEPSAAAATKSAADDEASSRHRRHRDRLLASLPLLVTTDPRVAAELAAAYDDQATALFDGNGGAAAANDDMQPHLPYSLSRLAAFRDHMADVAADIAHLAAGPHVTLAESDGSDNGTPEELAAVEAAAAEAVAEAVETGRQLLSYMLGRGMVRSARLVVWWLREVWGVPVAGTELLAEPTQQQKRGEHHMQSAEAEAAAGASTGALPPQGHEGTLLCPPAATPASALDGGSSGVRSPLRGHTVTPKMSRTSAGAPCWGTSACGGDGEHGGGHSGELLPAALGNSSGGAASSHGAVSGMARSPDRGDGSSAEARCRARRSAAAAGPAAASSRSRAAAAPAPAAHSVCPRLDALVWTVMILKHLLGAKLLHRANAAADSSVLVLPVLLLLGPLALLLRWPKAYGRHRTAVALLLYELPLELIVYWHAVYRIPCMAALPATAGVGQLYWLYLIVRLCVQPGLLGLHPLLVAAFMACRAVPYALAAVRMQGCTWRVGLAQNAAALAAAVATAAAGLRHCGVPDTSPPMVLRHCVLSVCALSSPHGGPTGGLSLLPYFDAIWMAETGCSAD